MSTDRNNIQRWAGLLFSLFGILLAYWDMSLNVIAIPLKDTFNYTQSQVELVLSMATAGISLTFLETLVSTKFGYLVSYLVGWVFSSAGLLSLYVAVIYEKVFRNWPFLIGVSQLVTCTLVACLIQLFASIAVNNFPKKHTGKIIGVFSATGACGKFFYAGIFEIFFKNNFAGFLLTMSVIWGVGFGTCFCVHRPLPLAETESALSQEYCVRQSYGSGEQLLKKPTGREMLRNPKFHMILWSSTLVFSCDFTLLNNITLIGQSAGMPEPLDLVYFVSGVIVFCCVASGFLYDKLPSMTAKFGILYMYYFGLMAGLVWGMAWFTKPGITLTAVLIGVAGGCGYAIPLSLMVTMFGGQNYSLFSALFNLLLALHMICQQTFMGFIYDHETTRNAPSNRCTGQMCFLASFGFLLGLCSVATLILSVALYIERQAEIKFRNSDKRQL